MVEFSSVWPVGLILLLLVFVASTPLLRAADAPPIESGSRVDNLDGLRGFLALAVFFSHTIVYHNYLVDGRWRLTPFPLFTMLGETGVSLFFMITGYLFWSQLLNKGGRPDWARLYLGRFFRILPLYWFAISLVIAGAAFYTGFRIRVPLGQLGCALAQWGAGGLRPEVPINGYADSSVLIAGVTWTLGYEWKFYAALLPLSLLARVRGVWRGAPVLALVLLLGYLVVRPGRPTADPTVCVALFLSGMSVASTSLLKLPRPWGAPLASVTVVILLCTIFLEFSDVYAPLPIAILAICFFLVVSGATGFGLLRTLPARRLGNISFGIYLLQGPIFAASFAVPAIRAFALSSPRDHWSVVAGDGLVLVVAAAIAHSVIERPAIVLGKRVIDRVGPLPRFRSERLPARVG